MNKVEHHAAFKQSYGQTRIGVYGICVQNNKILMTKTWAGDRHIYNFPGGGLEQDETLADCLTRECQEELECEIKILDLLATSDKLYENSFFQSQYFNIYYLIELKDPINEFVQDFAWFDLNQLPLHMIQDSDKFIIQNFLKN